MPNAAKRGRKPVEGAGKTRTEQIQGDVTPDVKERIRNLRDRFGVVEAELVRRGAIAELEKWESGQVFRGVSSADPIAALDLTPEAETALRSMASSKGLPVEYVARTILDTFVRLPLEQQQELLDTKGEAREVRVQGRKRGAA